MLTPSDICILVEVDGKHIELKTQQYGYGLANGKMYKQGKNRLDPDDQEVLVYWESFPITAKTTFLGKIPTPENVFDLETYVSFEVKNPSAIYRHRLQVANKLALETFAEDVASHIRWVMSRLACEFSAIALVDGPAEVEARNKLRDELTNKYELEGIIPQDIRLKKIERKIKGREFEFLLKKIEMEAKERGQALEEAFQKEKEELTEQAERDNKQADKLVTKLAGVNSFAELQARTPKQKSPIKLDLDKPCATVSTEPVLTDDITGGKLAILSNKHRPRYYEILRPWFFIGRDDNCHVTLSSHGVSSLHATIARVGSSLAVIDHNSVNGTFYNGERIHQLFIQTGDILRIEDFWILFKLKPSQEFRDIDYSCRGSIASSGQTVPHATIAIDSPDSIASEDNISAFVQLVSSSGHVVTSDSHPIVIGHDSACDLRISGGGVARFHAIIFWNRDGVYVDDLYSGRGTLRSGSPVQRVKLENGDTLEVGGHRITVSIMGNVSKRAEVLFNAQTNAGGLAATCIEGPSAGNNLRLGPQTKPIVLGTKPNCDFVLSNEEISGEHARIKREVIKGKAQFMITDLDSTNGTLVNGKKLGSGKPCRIGPGDIIRLSSGEHHSDLLVHYHF